MDDWIIIDSINTKPFLKMVKKFIREITITDNKIIFIDNLLPFLFLKGFSIIK